MQFTLETWRERSETRCRGQTVFGFGTQHGTRSSGTGNSESIALHKPIVFSESAVALQVQLQWHDLTYHALRARSGMRSHAERCHRRRNPLGRKSATGGHAAA